MKEYSTKQMQECNTAVNDALRLIFWYDRWESVRALRESFGYFSLTELFAIAHHRNKVISSHSLNSAIEETSLTRQRCVRAVSQRVVIMWHMYGETEGQKDGWKDSQNMLVDHLFQSRISPWSKTAKKRVLHRRDGPTDRPTDGPTDRKVGYRVA